MKQNLSTQHLNSLVLEWDCPFHYVATAKDDTESLIDRNSMERLSEIRFPSREHLKLYLTL